MKKENIIRCDMCRKFIGYNQEDIDIKYTPDTDGSIESTTFTHYKCLPKMKKDETRTTIRN